MNLEPDAVIAHAPDCLAADMGEELVLMSSARGIYLALDQVGSDIWSRIAQPCTFEALCDALSQAYDASRPVIEADVAMLLGKLRDAGVVEIGADPQGGMALQASNEETNP